MTDSLIFCDSTSITDFTSIDFSNSKIISFDISSHNLLDSQNINHELVEDYLDNDNFLINDMSMNFCQNWYKQNLAQEFVYDDINLGSMIELEMNSFFLKQLKKIIGIKNILDKEKPKSIFATDSLLKICTFFDPNNYIRKSKLPVISRNSLSYDKVSLPIKIGSKSITLWLSRSTATKIARIFESILNNIFNVKFNNSKKYDETILLLDFTPRPYDLFLKILSNKFSNVLLLNDEVTTTWNLKNISIIKNTKSKISSLYKFNTDKTNKKITALQSKINKNLDDLFNDKNIEYFSYNDINFWDLIKFEFIEICKTNFTTSIKVIESAFCFFSNVNLKYIAVLYGNVFQQSVLFTAKKCGIPVIRLQHGLDPFTNSWSKYLPIHYPSHQDNLLHALWSSYDKEYLSNSKVITNEKLIVIGNPRYDKFFNSQKTFSTNNTLLLSSNFGNFPFNLSGDDTKEAKQHKKIFEESCYVLNNIKNKKLIVKLHPGVIPTYDVQEITKKINPQIPVYKSQHIISLLQNCDVLINIGFSTILLEAMILGKPTITIMTDPEFYQDDVIIKNEITKPVYNSQELKSAIDSMLNDKHFKENYVQKGTEFVQSYLANPGNASNSLIKYLKSIN
jgi:hypothetical protein